MAADLDTFGGRLADAIRDSGLTQAEVAGQAGIKREGTLSDWKKLETAPKSSLVGQVADALFLNRRWLNSGEGPRWAVSVLDEAHRFGGARASAIAPDSLSPERRELPLADAVEQMLEVLATADQPAGGLLESAAWSGAALKSRGELADYLRAVAMGLQISATAAEHPGWEFSMTLRTPEGPEFVVKAPTPEAEAASAAERAAGHSDGTPQASGERRG